MTQETNIPKESRVCSDCRGELQAIRILDKGHYSIQGDLEYASLMGSVKSSAKSATNSRWLMRTLTCKSAT